ncbi:hypothetical protein [Haloferax sp. Q22]|uniref:hypothetical protein n=1 Tax=Haloferax sp. (strain Q22) TaxID=1526048 RepID=UPI00155E65BF|nr:hypothetical protein [Haloferax sp. Q22]
MKKLADYTSGIRRLRPTLTVARSPFEMGHLMDAATQRSTPHSKTSEPTEFFALPSVSTAILSP